MTLVVISDTPLDTMGSVPSVRLNALPAAEAQGQAEAQAEAAALLRVGAAQPQTAQPRVT